MTIEQFPHETQPTFRQEDVPLFIAVLKSVEKYIGTPLYEKKLGIVMRLRFTGRETDPVALSQQFNAWRETVHTMN